MARQLKLILKPGGPMTQVPLAWFEEVTRAINAFYNMQGAGTVKIVMPPVPSEKDPVVIDGHTTLFGPNVTS